MVRAGMGAIDLGVGGSEEAGAPADRLLTIRDPLVTDHFPLFHSYSLVPMPFSISHTLSAKSAAKAAPMIAKENPTGTSETPRKP